LRRTSVGRKTLAQPLGEILTRRNWLAETESEDGIARDVVLPSLHELDELEEEYLSLSETGRVVRMIDAIWTVNWNAYGKLTPDKKAGVIIVPFEKFIEKPVPYVSAIADLLGTKMSKDTQQALVREKCPRPYSMEKHLEIKKNLYSSLSKSEIEVLERLIDDYERVSSGA